MRGHAYFLYGSSPRPVVGEGFVLVGDSAGLAYAQSGEGILPAIESGLMAAEVIRSVNGDFSASKLQGYARRLADRYGNGAGNWAMRAARSVPDRALQFAASRLIVMPWFVRNVVLDRWFLHR
jgi:flavin-dependent dehydrogenase